MKTLLRCTGLALAMFYSVVTVAQYDLSPDKLAAIPVEVMPAQDNVSLRAAEEKADRPGRAPEFAVVMPVKIRPGTNGAWETKGANSVWRTRISSPGALTLNLGFSEYNLPEGAELYLVTPTERFGPLTSADNEDHNQLWTPMLDGDEMMVELTVPTASKKEVQLYLTAVNHDFRGVSKLFSGACNLDVICGEANGYGIVDQYRDIIRSVAAYSLGGSRFCTGFLVNNVNNDGKPFFMTAYHCGIGTNEAPSLVAYWNYENQSCRNPNSSASGSNGNGNLTTVNLGATHLASNPASDMTILLLDDPVNPAANAFFAGWDARAETPTDTLIGIHHPSGEEKRISFSFQEPFRAEYNSLNEIPDGNHLTIPDWDIGTTEGGSSGSPIFDRFKRVQGQLHGGLAACGNDLRDSYGYFHTSWEGDGTPETRLKDWLDPCNTGTLFIDGFDASEIPVTLTAESNCTNGCNTSDNMISFTLGEGFPAGTTLEIESFTGGISPQLSTATATGGEVVDLIIPGGADIAIGDYEITVRATGGGATDDITFEITLTTGVLAAPSVAEPADGATEVIPSLTIGWVAVDDAVGYDFELSDESDFSNILISVSGTEETNLYITDPLDGATTFYWRVRTLNDCGPGEWATYSFSTADISCAASEGMGLPAAISANGGNVQVPVALEVTESFSVASIEVSIDILHTYVGDLDARLISPEGTEISLFGRINDGPCGGDNISVTFSDDADLTQADFLSECNAGDISTQGTFQAAELLSTFADEQAMGTWTLIVTDNANADGGSITGFSILFCGGGDITDLSISSTTQSLEVCETGGASVGLELGSSFSGDVGLRVDAGGQMLDNYTFSYNEEDQTMTVDFTAFTLLGEGDYTMTFTVINGDGSEEDLSISLRVEAGVVEANLASPEDNVEVLDGEITFNWDASAGATSYVLQYSTNADFSVITFEEELTGTIRTLTGIPTGDIIFWRVIARNDCGEAISPVRQFRIIPSGILDFGSGRELSVYPNPVRGLLTVEATGNWPTDLRAVLFDATGRHLKEYNLNGAGQVQWDLGAIPAGVYYLRFASLGLERTERLVVLP
ncbi:T9SS type A sorting domain-containing protein [Neolewinella aurantiaca]|uniref:T9SS type A sorting domain-containing protein n=1 Tax=Neolewinella aurantiaca TaxID=2602767 RepID=A0A5C7FII5_9BACT|nr:proprotein convertase P-domain-containing protein [Neolewinella aurantiaca]TXF87127.1 T9SS type A sorting domain-containing protein [Neolewinella aurantiaca]